MVNSCRATNIKSLSTSEHPGLVTIFEAGKGQDVKGILPSPIKLTDYAFPWEFQTALVQSFNATAGVGAKTQINYAIGSERRRHVFGSRGPGPPIEVNVRPTHASSNCWSCILAAPVKRASGLPQFSREPHPENYFVWGRGDLGRTVMGDWGYSLCVGLATARSTPVRPVRNFSFVAC